MNRRHLFNLLVGAALAPEQLIKPVTYFLPPKGGWISRGGWTMIQGYKFYYTWGEIDLPNADQIQRVARDFRELEQRYPKAKFNPGWYAIG